jgi:hypothetical protein
MTKKKALLIETSISFPSVEYLCESALALSDDYDLHVLLVDTSRAWRDFGPEGCRRFYYRSFKQAFSLVKKNLPMAKIMTYELHNSYVKNVNVNLEELKKFTHLDCSIGYGLVSSLISLSRDSAPNLSQKTVNKIVFSNCQLIDHLEKILLNQEYNLICTFNGRLSYGVTIAQVAKKHSVPVKFYERGCDENHFWLSSIRTNDFDSLALEMRKKWEGAGSKKVDLARKYFASLRTGMAPFTLNVVKKMTESIAEVNLSPKIVIFTSSDDEFAALGEGSDEGPFGTQVETISRVLHLARVHGLKNIMIRVHPNIQRKSKRERTFWESYRPKGATLVQADDSINSYALLAKAEKIIVFGSQIGIEAAYAGKPTALLGPSRYQAIDCCYRPGNEQELLSFLLMKDHPKKSVHMENSLKYAYFYMSYGEKCVLVRALSSSHGYCGDIRVPYRPIFTWLIGFLRG